MANNKKKDNQGSSSQVEPLTKIKGTNADDILSGGDGDEKIEGGKGNDNIFGGAGNDEIKGGSGNDIVNGGSGNDDVDGGQGDDLAIFNVAENTASDNTYDGGAGIDTLLLEMTREEWMRDDIQQDIANVLQFISEKSNPSGQANANTFNFQAFDLEIRRFESLRVTVDGVELDPVDEPVTANDSSSSTSGEHDPVSGNVLDNDDVPDLVRSVALITPPTKGELTFNDDGGFTYEPGDEFDYLAEGEKERVSFTYRVVDADHDEDTATVSIDITGTNDAPIANPDAGTSQENSAISVDVLANDTDVDTSDTHTVIQAAIASGAGTVAIVDNRLEWTPGTDYDYLALGEEATVVIDYSVSDNHGGIDSSTLTLTITGSNDGPVANVDSGNTEENTVLSVDVLANDTDVDTSDTHTVDKATIASGLGAVAIVDNQIEWSPRSDYDYLAVGESAQVVIDYTMSDNHSSEASSILTITVTGSNDAPIAVADTASLGENAAVTIDALANDTDVDASDTHTITSASIASGLGAVSVQNNTLVWSPAEMTAPGAGGASSLDGLEISPSVYDYLPEGESATVLVDYAISDGNGGVSASTATITVNGENDAPTVVAVEMQSVSEQDEVFDVDLLASANDVDSTAVLTAINVSEKEGKGGWTVNGNTLTIDPDYYDSLNNGESETLSINYQISDEFGATVDQTLDYTIEGFTDAPDLDVELADSQTLINGINIVINVKPAAEEEVNLSFANVPAGATIMYQGKDVAASGIINALPTLQVLLVLAPDADADTDLQIIATGVDDQGLQVGDTAVEPLDVKYSASTKTDSLSFTAVDQGMWSAGAAPQIGWHEYIPFVGTETEAWTSGKFNLVDISLNSDSIAADLLSFFQDALDLATGEQQVAQGNRDQTVADRDTAYKKAVHVDAVVAAKNDYNLKDGIYQTAHIAWRAAQDLADGASDNSDADAATLAEAQDHLATLQSQRSALEVDARISWSVWVPTPVWDDPFKGYWQTFHGHDPIKYALVLAKDVEIAAQKTAIYFIELEASGTEAVEGALQDAADLLLPARNEALANRTAAANHLDALEADMHDDGFYVGTNVDSFTVAAAWTEVAAKTTAIGVTEGILATAKAATALAQAAVDAAQGVIDTTDFNADFSFDLELHAKVGLQIDFALDTGSVDASASYDLQTQTQHNLTTDTLLITPMLVNLVTGDSVAFSTVSPNVQFYAGILYDVGADIDMFVDAAFAVGGTSLFDISGDDDGIRIQESFGMDGVITLIDFDSSDVGPVKMPFIESMTEGIVSVSTNIPNIATQGTAAPFSTSYFQEGDLLNVDFSEISSAFFNFIEAGIDFSPEIKAAFSSLGDIDPGSTGFDAVMGAVGDVLAGIWDVLNGTADTDGDGVVPIFLLDATDETSASLLHLNLVPDDLSGIDVDSGSLGFYVSYGESAPVVQVSIDIDQFVALVANLAVGNTSGEIINPLVKEYGLDAIMNLADVPVATADEIKKYVNASYTFEYADVDASTGWSFKQEFTLSIDDMLYTLELEDGTSFLFAANDSNPTLEIDDISQYDANGDGNVNYSLNLVPEAMFSNDTELGMSIGYTLDFLKANLAAGLKIPLADIFGVQGAPAIPIPLLNLKLGPLLRVKGDLDVLDVDVFENRFAFDLGNATTNGGISVIDDVINGTLDDDILVGNEGNDIFNGAGGNDLFIFAANHGSDVINDFNAGDVIDLAAVGIFNSPTEAQLAAIDDVNGHANIDLGGGNDITLVGVAAASLAPESFVV
ncbi:MAG: Ig-like domain-containing protein [Pseudohongiellaceae bacterium]